MCGRTRCTLRPDDFPRACHIRGRPVRHINMDRYRPSYNVSPGFNLPVVCRDDVGDGQDGQAKEQGAALHCMKWGLVPSFTKKTEKPDHYKMFNARSESIREKASFRRLVPNNRCLVAVEGFYEWKKDGSKKQPYYINFKDGRPLVFAALFDSWKNAEGEVFYTFTILTTSSSSSLQWLHDRMPVIFGNKESSDLWLYGSPTTNFDALLKPYGESDLAWYPVTPAVGKPSFDGPECIKEIQLKTEESKPISHFFSKKGAKSQKEEEKKTELMEKEPTEIDQPRSMKEEHETLESTDLQSTTNKDDVKPNVSASRKGTTDFPIKREYEEFSADTEPYADQTDQLASSPERKKGKIAHDGEANIPTKEEYEEVSSGTKLKKLSQSPVKVTGADVELKHEFEEHSADTKHSVDQTGKLATSPMKKKGKGASDKQPTLFSYFKKN